MDFDRGDALFVLRIPGFRHVVREQIDGDRLPKPFRSPKARSALAAVADDRDDRRHRDDAGRQHSIVDERVQQRRFSSFELADARDVEAPFGDPLAKRRASSAR